MEDLKDQVILEQLVNSLPDETRVWVRERRPKTSMEARQLADDFAQARKQNTKGNLFTGNKKNGDRPYRPLQCHQCGQAGHLARDCWTGAKGRDHEKDRGATWKPNERQRRDTKDVECFNCHKRGHYAARCPNNAMFCSGKRRDISREAEVTNVSHNKTEVSRRGIIEGMATQEILLDTGCSQSLVRREFVPTERILEGEAVAIRCAHGDTVLYPMADIRVEIGEEVFEVQVAVADRLPVAMLLGTDVPHLQRLLGEKWIEPFHGSRPAEDALVVTRAGRRRQIEVEMDLLQKDHNSEAKVHSLAEPTASEDESKSMRELAEMEGQQGDTSISELLPPFTDDMFEGGRERGHPTRKQKREDKKRHATNEMEEEEPLKHALDMSAEELQTLQETDTSLEAVRRASQGHPSSVGVGFSEKMD